MLAHPELSSIIWPGRVAGPIADPGVLSSIPAPYFVLIDHEIFSMASLLLPLNLEEGLDGGVWYSLFIKI